MSERKWGIILILSIVLVAMLAMPANAAMEGKWYTETVDHLNDLSPYPIEYATSLAIDSADNPHISYCENDVKYAYKPSPLQNWVIKGVSGYYGTDFCSLALNSSGRPAITYHYYDQIYGGALLYAAPKSDTPGKWDGDWDIYTVDLQPQGSNTGEHSSLAFDSYGYSHISYRDYQWINHDMIPCLAYLHGYGNSVVVDDNIDVGSTSLKLYRGYPRILYNNEANRTLKFAQLDGSGWIIRTLDADYPGDYSSFAIDNNGQYHISYNTRDPDYTPYLSYLVGGQSGDGQNWFGQSQKVDANYVGKYNSIAVDNSGNPKISYYDSNLGDLKFAWKEKGEWHTTTIDSAGDVGLYTSLALDSAGNPRITYIDQSNQVLKYAWFVPAPNITGINPNKGIIGTQVYISNLGGNHFSQTGPVTIELRKNFTSGTHPVYTIQATNVTVVSPTRITCNFILGINSPLGTWDVIVTNPDGQQGRLNNGFTITPRPPTADFVGSPREGKAPLQVTFNDTSTGNPTSWYWDFGDGPAPQISRKNVTHTYTRAGTYNVSLTAMNSGGSNKTTKYAYIHVNPTTVRSPVANFTATPASGVSPLTVIFNDTSTGNRPMWYSWQFGDGNTSSQRNVTHTFSGSGDYLVNFTVTNRFGANTKNKIIHVYSHLQPIEANFTASPRSGIVALEVHFQDQSTGYPPPQYYWWDFGEPGNPADPELFKPNPVHVYSIPGVYAVTLTVGNGEETDAETKLHYILVNPVIISPTPTPTPAGPPSANSPVAKFTASPRAGTVPLTVTFNDTSRIPRTWPYFTTHWYWEFGDGSNSTSRNVTHVYKVSGIYTVSLTVSGPTGSNTTIRQNYITAFSSGPVPPVASFVANPTAGPAPLNVTFRDTSTGFPTSWHWQFGDNQTSDQQNVNHVYTLRGIYTVSLKVRNAAGNSTLVKYDYIDVRYPAQPPIARFNATPTSGPAPLSVQFYDYSSGSPTSWYWQFGDGSTSTVNNPVHLYPQAGNYTVILTVGNSDGNDTVTKTGYIQVSMPPPVVRPPVSSTAPMVTAITPNSGISGTSVSGTNINGLHFQDGTTIILTRSGQGDIPATDVTVLSPDRITCTIPIPPDALPGPWNVGAMNPDGEYGLLRNAFTISAPLPAPEVSAITPNTGKAGTSVSITNLQGSNLRHGAGGTTVKLTRSGQGDILAKGVTVASSSQIICSIPIPSGAAPGQWNVVVINPGGKSGILPYGFTITQAL